MEWNKRRIVHHLMFVFLTQNHKNEASKFNSKKIFYHLMHFTPRKTFQPADFQLYCPLRHKTKEIHEIIYLRRQGSFSTTIIN